MIQEVTYRIWYVGERGHLILITNYKRCNGHQHCADAHGEKSHLIKLSFPVISSVSHLLQNYPVSILPDRWQVWDEAKDESADQRGHSYASHKTSCSLSVLLIRMRMIEKIYELNVKLFIRKRYNLKAPAGSWFTCTRFTIFARLTIFCKIHNTKVIKTYILRLCWPKKLTPPLSECARVPQTLLSSSFHIFLHWI